MGRIRRIRDGKIFAPWSQTLIGRDSICSLVLDQSPSVSAVHARLFYRDGQWLLIDLGSRNGTFVIRPDRAEPLRVSVERDGSRALRVGDTIRFGEHDEDWVFESGESPFPEAESLRTGRRIPARGAGVLILESEGDLLSVSPGPDGLYRLELPEQVVRPLEDPPIVEFEGERYRVAFDAMPMTPPCAHDLMEGALEYSEPAPGASHLEYVQGLQRTDLHTYVCYRTVGALARERQRDRERNVGEARVGWVIREELAQRLGRSLRALAVDLHRCQEYLRAAGIGGVEHLFERRVGRKIRLGSDVDVRVVDAPPSAR